VRRRIKTIELSPEQIGLCGCWRIAAVERVTIDLTLPEHQRQPVTEIAYYAASTTKEQLDDAELLDAIVGHWAAIENGTHRVRDVTFGEDACRVAHHNAARNMVTLRNLAIGLYNLLLHQGKTDAPSLPSWQRSMSVPQALKHVMR
jgi:predicted transposase YbfD/YdcC